MLGLVVNAILCLEFIKIKSSSDTQQEEDLRPPTDLPSSTRYRWAIDNHLPPRNAVCMEDVTQRPACSMSHHNVCDCQMQEKEKGADRELLREVELDTQGWR